MYRHKIHVIFQQYPSKCLLLTIKTFFAIVGEPSSESFEAHQKLLVVYVLTQFSTIASLLWVNNTYNATSN
jgi:hypothetical protein